MDDDPKVPDEDADPAQGGVFGKLPDTRAGSRSPRRDAARAGRRTAGAKPRPAGTPGKRRGAPATAEPGGAQASPGGPASDREAAGVTPTSENPAEAAEGSGRGLEDVAWAGIAAAAEAATVGVRLAGRAFEALRETVERR